MFIHPLSEKLGLSRFQNPLRYGIALIVFLIVFFTVWKFADSYFQKKSLDLFENATSEHFDKIDSRLQNYGHMLHSGVGFINGSDHVSREEWHRFVDALKPTLYYPGLQGIGYALMLHTQDVRKIRAQLRHDGFTTYTLDDTTEQHSAILYLEPMDERNRNAIGYDMFSEPTRHAAMQRAIDTNTMSMTGRVTLVQEIDENIQPGFLVYIPYYGKNGVPDTLEERRRNIVGFIYSPVRMNDFMGSFALKQQNFSIDIYDDNVLLYSSARTTPVNSKYIVQKRLEIGGRTWTMTYRSLPAFETKNNNYVAIIVTLAITVFILLLIYIVWDLLRNRILLKEKNAELEKSRFWLDHFMNSSADGIHILDKNGHLLMYSPSFRFMLGYTEEEMKQLTVFGWEANNSEEWIRHQLNFLTEEAITFETIFKRKNGSLIHVEVKAHRFVDEGENLIFASSWDITKRKKAELKVLESEHFYKTVFSSLKEGLIIVYAGRVIDCNDVAGEIFETEKHRLIGKEIFDVTFEIISVEKTFAEHIIDAFEFGQASFTASIRLSPDNNELKIVRMTLSSFGLKTDQKMIFIIHDITRKIAEDRILTINARQAQMGEMISMIAHQWR